MTNNKKTPQPGTAWIWWFVVIGFLGTVITLTMLGIILIDALKTAGYLTP